MKIIILCNSLTGGGAEKVASDTFHIIKKDHTYDVKLASSDNYADIVLKKSKSNNFFKAFFNIKNLFLFLLALIKEKPNVIHIHNYLTELTVSVLVSIWIYKLFYRKKVRVIQTLHDHHLTCPNSSLYDDNHKLRCMACINNKKLNVVKNKCYQGSRLKSIFKYLRFLLIKIFTRKLNIIDLFLCPSEFIRNIVIKDGIAIERTELLRNPISDNYFNSNLVKCNESTLSKTNILFLGRLVKIKSIETIIQATQLCLNDDIAISVDICGDGDQKRDLETLIQKEHLSEHIILRGKVDIAAMQELASQSDILVLPSIVFENAPLVIYEAVSMGLFPIVSNIGGMQEAVKTINYGSVFEAGDPLSLKKAIKNYINNKCTIKLGKEKSRKEVMKLCSELKYSESLDYIYSYN